jgi:hypothetical protein
VNTTGQKFLRGYQITDANGQVRFTTIHPGWYTGRRTAITVGLTLNVAAAGPPAVATGGVANAVSGAAGVAPGAWMSIYGTNFSTASDLVDESLPTSLGGVSVEVNGKAAFV